jgi:hypothetical protein
MDQEITSAEEEVKAAEKNLNNAILNLKESQKKYSPDIAKRVESAVFAEMSKYGIHNAWVQSAALVEIIAGVTGGGMSAVMSRIKKMSQLGYFENIKTNLESWPHRGPNRKRGILFTTTGEKHPSAILYLEGGEVKCMTIHPTKKAAKEANKEFEPIFKLDYSPELEQRVKDASYHNELFAHLHRMRYSVLWRSSSWDLRAVWRKASEGCRTKDVTPAFRERREVNKQRRRADDV